MDWPRTTPRPAGGTRRDRSPAERIAPFLVLLRGYRFPAFRADFTAGLTVALFTIPQAMAYALIAGFPPSVGIATAAVASVLGAVFGSSEFLVNGPTNAIAVMLAANAGLFAARGDPVEAMITLTLMVGVGQTAGAFLRLGSLTRYVSEPVLTGFTAGAGLYIVVNQLPSLFGIAHVVRDIEGWEPPHAAVFDLIRFALSVEETNLAALAVGVGTFAAVRVVQAVEPRVGRKLPAPFLAIVLATFTSVLLGLGDPAMEAAKIKVVRDIEPLTRALMPVRVPEVDLAGMVALWQPALAISVLGAVEAIAIGKVLAARAGHEFDASRQLLGEGLCNVGAAMVGGFASSGSFSRTAVNFEAGAVTRISCVLSGVLVLGIVLLFAPQANHIPIAALAGTLMHIGFKLVDASRIQATVSTTNSDAVVFITTFTAVLALPHLEWALLAGVLVSAFQALRRAGGFKLTVVEERADGSLWERPGVHPRDVGDVAFLNLQGELFFAAADELERQLRDMLDDNTRFLVVRVREAYNLDATMAEALAHVARDARERGGLLLLSGVSAGMYGTLQRAGALDVIGAEHVFRHEGALLSSTWLALQKAHRLAAEAPPEPRTR